MPAAPVHHTPVDKTGAWDGSAQVKKFDKKEGDFPKFYAWVDEGEHDEDADGTDKEDGWGPHHECDDSGIPGDANLKGVEAAMAALNGAHGTTSRIPDADRDAVHAHLAAHYKNAGYKDAEIPDLASRAHDHPHGEHRAGTGYTPDAYSQQDGENVGCPECGRMNDRDANYCDQCDCHLEGRDDVEVDGTTQATYESAQYGQGPDENVCCPGCNARNMSDAHFCDQCGAKLEGVGIVEDLTGDGEDISDESSGMNSAGDYVTDPDNRSSDRDDKSGHGRRPSRARADSATDVAPKDDLVRARPGSVGLRSVAPDAGGNGSTMYGHFATFNDQYEVEDWWEGNFMESLASSAFDDTFANDIASIRCIYNHGWDEMLGLKPLGPVGPPAGALRSDDVGPYYEVPLLDTSYNRDYLLPALQGRLMSGEQVGSQLGSSFRFSITEESWSMKPPASKTNPAGLPQRTIFSCQVTEFGPGMFPVNPAATAGVRSLTHEWHDRFRTDTAFVIRATEKYGARVVEALRTAQPPAGRPGLRSNQQHQQVPTETEPPVGRAARIKHIERRAKTLHLP